MPLAIVGSGSMVPQVLGRQAANVLLREHNAGDGTFLFRFDNQCFDKLDRGVLFLSLFFQDTVYHHPVSQGCQRSAELPCRAIARSPGGAKPPASDLNPARFCPPAAGRYSQIVRKASLLFLGTRPFASLEKLVEVGRLALALQHST